MKESSPSSRVLVLIFSEVLLVLESWLVMTNFNSFFSEKNSAAENDADF